MVEFNETEKVEITCECGTRYTVLVNLSKGLVGVPEKCGNCSKPLNFTTILFKIMAKRIARLESFIKADYLLKKNAYFNMGGD